MKKFSQTYNDLKEKNFFCRRVECSPVESKEYEDLFIKDQPLPEDICVEDRRAGGEGISFFRYQDDEKLTREDRLEYLLLHQAESLKSIRKMLCFFTVLTCIGIAASVISVLVALSQ